MAKLPAPVCTILFGLSLVASTQVLAAPYLIIGLDQKMLWDATGRPVYGAAGHDSVAIIDLARPEAPKIIATLPLENSVQGPPTNLAVSPDNRFAIVANSVTNVAKAGGGFEQVLSDQLFVIDLRLGRPKLVQTLTVGKQPSGLSINSAGTLAIVAYRGEHSVGVFRIDHGQLQDLGRVDVGESPSHVTFTPDGRRAIVVKQNSNKVAILNVNGEAVTFGIDLATADGPYNVEVTPDGRLGIINDRGILTIIDLTSRPESVIDSIKVEAGSEGLAISPRGDIAVSVALRGSNGPHSSPHFHERGAIVVLRIDGAKPTLVKTIKVGRVPEGVAFAPDGRHLYVANFYDNDVWIFQVNGSEVTDTGKRVILPGRPASARATPARHAGF